MEVRCKGFTLVEMIVTVMIVAIFSLVAIPAWQSQLASNRADADSSELYRALNFTRLEAINRGVNMQIRPTTDGAAWNSGLKVVPASDTAPQVSSNLVRAVSAPSTGATWTVSSSSGTTSYIEFNNLGVMITPAAAVTLAYARGTQTRTMAVCINGRVVQSGTCP